MRIVLLCLLVLASPAFAQPPAETSAGHARKASQPRSPVGSAMQALSQALRDAAEQARPSRPTEDGATREIAPTAPLAGATAATPASTTVASDTRIP